jgi:hypothetical protein
MKKPSSIGCVASPAPWIRSDLTAGVVFTIHQAADLIEKDRQDDQDTA